MNRFFRSALFPLIVIVLLVYLASQTLIPKSKAPEGHLLAADPAVKTRPVLDQAGRLPRAGARSTATDRRVVDGNKIKVNYPSDQSQVAVPEPARQKQVTFDSKGVGGSPWWSILVFAAAVRAPVRVLDLPDELDAGRRLEGDELRQEPREADGARLAEDRLQGRRRRRRGGRGAAGDQGVPREPEEVPGARRAHPEGRAALRPAWHRQDAARARGRRRGGRAVLLDLRLRLRRDVRRRRRLARARPVRAGQAGGAVHRLHRRDRRRRPASRRRASAAATTSASRR